MIVRPSLAFAQDPFTIGNGGDPFAVGAGGGGTTSDSNVTLQIRSDTDWSGSYGSAVVLLAQMDMVIMTSRLRVIPLG